MKRRSIEKVFEQINFSSIYYYDGGWKSFIQRPGFLNNLEEIDSDMGVWIDMYNDAILKVYGTFKKMNFSLEKGWNLIGYPSTETKAIGDVFADVLDDILSVYMYNNTNWYVYNPNDLNHSNFDNIQPGFGYWVKVNKDTNWVFEDEQFKNS